MGIKNKLFRHLYKKKPTKYSGLFPSNLCDSGRCRTFITPTTPYAFEFSYVFWL